MPSLLTLGKIGALTDVNLQGSTTISGQILSGGSNPLAFVGSFDFSGAIVTGLNSGSFNNSIFTGLSTFQGPALFQSGVDFELGFDASLGTAVLGDQIWANGSDITLLGTTTVGGLGSLIFTPGTTVDFDGANVSTDSITVTNSLVGSSDPLNPTQLIGYWDFGDPLPFVTRVIQVNKGGSDLTGDGTDAKPYLSVGYAVTTITDATSLKRYVINAGPGDYDENITLKAWVFVAGYFDLTVRFNGVIDINDPSWSAPGLFDFRSGFSSCVFRNPLVVFDFVTANSLYGKIYLQSVNSNNTISFIGRGPVNQAFIFGGNIFGGITSQGVNVFTTAVFFQGGTVTGISSPNAPTLLTLTACVQTGSLNVNATGNTVTCSLYESFIANQVTVSGANATLLATCGSLPRRANVTVLAGATLTLLNDAAGMAYTPSSPASWPLPTPTTVQQALDDLIDGVASPIVSVDPSATAFAGGGQSPSYQITDYFTVVTIVASSGDSVVLPASVVGTVSVIKNRGANPMDIYPPVGSSLNALPINTPLSLVPLTSITYICSTATNWESAS